MLLNELDTKYSEANRLTAQALRDYAEEQNKSMIAYDGEGSMDYELFITVADAIEAGDVDTVAKEINDADTEPRDFMMDLLLDKHPEMAKSVSMKVSGTLQSIFGMTGRMPAEEAVQEAKGKYEFGPPTGKETFPGGYEHDARMITHIISDLSPRIKDDQVMLDVQDALSRIESNTATKADIKLAMDIYKDIVAQGLDKPYKDALGKFDQDYDPNDPSQNEIEEGRVKSWLMDMEEDAYDMTREEFIAKHGESHVDVWDKVHSGEEEYEPDFAPESVEEGRMGFSDLEKLGAENASKVDMEARRRGSADMEPGDADRLRFKVAKEMGLVKEGTEMGKIGDVFIKQFAGGKEKGLSVQLTDSKGSGYVQMTKDEAKQIAERLMKWATSDDMAYPGEYESVNEAPGDMQKATMPFMEVIKQHYVEDMDGNKPDDMGEARLYINGRQLVDDVRDMLEAENPDTEIIALSENKVKK